MRQLPCFAHGHAVHRYFVRIGFHFTHSPAFHPSSVRQTPSSTHRRPCSFAWLAVWSLWLARGRYGFPNVRHLCFSLPLCPYWYTTGRFLVPTTCSPLIGAPDGTPMYRLHWYTGVCVLVPNAVLCSLGTPECVSLYKSSYVLSWYFRGYFPVPNANNTSVCTPISYFVYRSLVFLKKLLALCIMAVWLAG